ncbi:MAG: prepilin-type N-terminal cleavage/methylation domain-containing protein, partial [Kosmotogaceae bacterium]
MLQKLNKKLSHNQKGFSLIELMVAVTILALAAFGIFQAFTTGFMGMTDAKERTVATNLAQKIMEDIKSKSAINVTGGYPSETISEKTYDISVNSYEQDEKAYVTVTVSWPDRNGNTKTVDLETVFYDLDTAYVTPDPVVDEIILTLETDPNLVMSCDNVPIKATVIDINENPVEDGVAVIFSLEGEGEFSPYLVPTKDGTAVVTLSLVEDSGTQVTVTASSGEVNSDPLIIDINSPNLLVTTEQTSLAICEELIVTATLWNSQNSMPMTGKRIDFTSDGFGEVLSRNYNITDGEGKARTTVYSETIISGGTNVTAEYCGIEAYTGNITFTEPTFSIETNHAALAICQSSTITATLLRNDGSDTPISGEEIEFTANSGGTLS